LLFQHILKTTLNVGVYTADMIYVQAEAVASWEPPLLEEVDQGGWIYQGRSEYYVNCHIQV
jgi:hypothetical protein